MNELQEIIYDNYEDLRNNIIKKYDNYYIIKSKNEGIFHGVIDKQFIDTLHSYIVSFLVQRNVTIKLDDIKIFVEDTFPFDNLERIISDDGDFTNG